VGTTGLSEGLGEGIIDGPNVGWLAVGSFVGVGDGKDEGIELGDGEGIREGLAVGSGVVGYKLGDLVGVRVGKHVSHFNSIHE